MTEIQISGLSILLTAIPVLLLASHIEKRKHYTLFTGWDASRISDEDACGRMMCKGLRTFSYVMGLGGAFIFLTQMGGDLFVIALVFLSIVPLLYYVLKARKLYWS